ncbi:ATP synthase complex subunit H-domain-containing protein [Papiliotrema laurentii]|uniref:ATP synthase complex subunit H-domain-containing protein n=1 Tax=Papiliotrema laurentii TaxID=5418 RepID=A0AAD9L7T0_PAPLA|nr:ATP synthase complex subunit H-domain-containing protein [Papiliotrema laurentii]
MASVLRLGARRVAPSFSRSFSVSAVSKKDLVQDLYLNQLRNYKPAPQAKDAHVGVVRNYNAPTPPQAPALPSDLHGELAKFDAQEPVIGSSSKPVAATVDGGESAEEYLAFLEKDYPKVDAHH